MSLETKIDRLIVAMETLTATIERLFEPATPEQKGEVKSEPPAPQLIVVSNVTAEELQSLCIQTVRTDRSKKDAVLAILGDYNGAKVISDIDAAYYPAIKTKLEALTNV
jgi:hypothetical protein